MLERNELSDILLMDNLADRTQRKKRLLLIVASLLILFVLILAIVKTLNKPSGLNPVVGDDLLPIVTQQNGTTDETTSLSQNEMPTLSQIEEIKNESDEIKEPDSVVPNVTVPSVSTPNITTPNVTTPVVVVPEVVKQNQTAPKPEQTAPKPTQTTPATTPKVATQTTPKVTQTTPSQTVSKGKYYIQVGAFAETPSKDFMRKIEQKNYNFVQEEVVSNSRKITKVFIGPYNSEEEARNVLLKVREDIVKDAFLLKK